MNLFREAASGRAPLDGDSALLYIYGIYLSNGGNPDDFMELTMDDIQIMTTAYLGTQKRIANAVVTTLLKALNRDNE